MNDKENFSEVTHYTHVDVQPGGINIQHVEHLHQADILNALGIEVEVKKREKAAETQTEEVSAMWPNELCTDEAMGYWRKLERKGFVESEQHRLTATTTLELAAYIGNRFADELNIANKWKVFERGWNVKNLGVSLNRLNNRVMSRELKKTLSVIDEVFE